MYGTFLYEGNLNLSVDYFSFNSFNICGKYIHVSLVVTLNKSATCPNIVCVLVLFSQLTQVTSIKRINRFAFITDTECVLFEVETKFFYTILMNLVSCRHRRRAKATDCNSQTLCLANSDRDYGAGEWRHHNNQSFVDFIRFRSFKYFARWFMQPRKVQIIELIYCSFNFITQKCLKRGNSSFWNTSYEFFHTTAGLQNRYIVHPYYFFCVVSLYVSEIYTAYVADASRRKALASCHSLAGIAGSNSAGGMDVCLLWMLFVMWGRGLRIGLISRPEESHRVWCVWVWSCSLDNEGIMAH